MLITLIAIIAPLLNSLQQIPQLYKTYDTKHVRDLSFESLLVMFISSMVWVLHGIIIWDPSLLISASISTVKNIIKPPPQEGA
jgi:MtN3 and saliva related transmembrane protein